MEDNHKRPLDLDLLPAHMPSEQGMSIMDRLRALTSPGDKLPKRQIPFDSQTDPYGLLEHTDTYEAIAAGIFQECEGIYKQLVRVNPEVDRQFNTMAKRSKKRPRAEYTIMLPSAKLGNLYNFHMSRSQQGLQTSYLFQRADQGYEDSGFRVTKDESGSIVLKNLNPDETDTDNDQEYYRLLMFAHAWVQDYAATLNLHPKDLLKFADTELIPRTASTIVKNGLKQVYTTNKGSILVPKSKRELFHGRRPRYSAVLLTALALPIPGHAFLGVDAANGVSSLLTSGKSHKLVNHEPKPNPRLAAINAFDAFKPQLPTSSAVTVGASLPVTYSPTLNPLIEKAPVYSDGIKLGQVRRLNNIDTVYPGGFDGLEARACASEIVMTLGQTAVRIVNTDPLVKQSLTATVSNNRVAICNTSGQDLAASSLDGIYVQPLN